LYDTVNAVYTGLTVRKRSNSDYTHPKGLGEGSGAIVEWVRNGDQRGFCPPTRRGVLVLLQGNDSSDYQKSCFSC